MTVRSACSCSLNWSGSSAKLAWSSSRSPMMTAKAKKLPKAAGRHHSCASAAVALYAAIELFRREAFVSVDVADDGQDICHTRRRCFLNGGTVRKNFTSASTSSREVGRQRARTPPRHVKLFKNGRNQAVRIPREFELPGEDAIMRKEGERLIIEPTPPNHCSLCWRP
jgi:hypothetical protein